MPYHTDQDAVIAELINGVILREDLARKTWKAQTDAVKAHFAVAQMAAEDEARLFLFDARIETRLITEALKFSEDPKNSVTGYFSKRCHDKGLKCPRLILLDTKSTRGMGRRESSKFNLHAHGFAFIPEGETVQGLRRKLRGVFGTATRLTSYQYKIRNHDKGMGYSFAGRKGYGASGKLNYTLNHAGATHRHLGLNEDGKRSRKAPACRRKANVNSSGLAHGVPSNFLQNLIWDNVSKTSGRLAFEAWIKAASENKPAVDHSATKRLQEVVHEAFAASA